MTVDRSAPGVRVVALPDVRAAQGVPIPLGDRLMSFTYEDDERRADKCTLRLDNHDLRFFDDERLLLGGALDVAWGYRGRMAAPRRVLLKKLKGFEALTLEGRAESVRLDQQQRTRAWSDVSRSEVARLVARAWGYGEAAQDIEDTEEVFDTIQQSAETDARLLRRLASREGFVFSVKEGVFRFHRRRRGAAPTHTLTWRGGAAERAGDIMSVSVESDLGRRVGRVRVRGRDPLAREDFEVSATNADLERFTDALEVLVIDPETGADAGTRAVDPLDRENATATEHGTSATTPARARREAAARFRLAEEGSVKLSLTVVGDVTLRAKGLVDVLGLGPRLSGRYRVRSVSHAVSGSGYVCSLKLARDGAGRRAGRPGQPHAGDANDHPPAASGPAGGGDTPLVPVEVIDPDTGLGRLLWRPRRGGGR